MKRTRILSVLFFAMLLVLPQIARAQTVKAADAVASQQDSPKQIPVDFPGGSVGEYIALLKKLDSSLSVIVTPSAAKVELPPIEIQKVTSDEAVSIVERCFDDEPKVSVEHDQINQDDSIWTIRATGVASELVVLNIAPVIESDSKEESDHRLNSFLNAVETGLKMLGEGSGELKIHPETRLLFFRGTKRQIRTVEQIVEQISFHHSGPKKASSKNPPVSNK